MADDDKKKKGADKGTAENTQLTLGLQPKEGETIMAVCHIYASFNDTPSCTSPTPPAVRRSSRSPAA